MLIAVSAFIGKYMSKSESVAGLLRILKPLTAGRVVFYERR